MHLGRFLNTAVTLSGCCCCWADFEQLCCEIPQVGKRAGTQRIKGILLEEKARPAAAQGATVEHPSPGLSPFRAAREHGDIKETKCQDPARDHSGTSPAPTAGAAAFPVEQGTNSGQSGQRQKSAAPEEETSLALLIPGHSWSQVTAPSRHRAPAHIIPLQAQIQLLTGTSS